MAVEKEASLPLQPIESRQKAVHHESGFTEVSPRHKNDCFPLLPNISKSSATMGPCRAPVNENSKENGPDFLSLGF